MHEACRGVFEAIWTGPNGETVLVIVNSAGREVIHGGVVVPRGCDVHGLATSLLAFLDTIDPVSVSVTGRLPRWRRVGHAHGSGHNVSRVIPRVVAWLLVTVPLWT